MNSVLIIEDNVLLCKLYQRQISAAFPNVSIRAVHNSLDALKATAASPSDVVVMDCRMPGCGYLELLDGILEISPNTAIIIASADPPKDLRCRSYREKVLGVLEKPFEAEELIDLLNKAFLGKTVTEGKPPFVHKDQGIRPALQGAVPFDRHEMINTLSSIFVAIRAFEADLLSDAENPPAIRETIAEYVPKILRMVERASAQVKRVEE